MDADLVEDIEILLHNYLCNAENGTAVTSQNSSEQEISPIFFCSTDDEGRSRLVVYKFDHYHFVPDRGRW